MKEGKLKRNAARFFAKTDFGMRGAANPGRGPLWGGLLAGSFGVRTVVDGTDKPPGKASPEGTPGKIARPTTNAESRPREKRAQFRPFPTVAMRTEPFQAGGRAESSARSVFIVTLHRNDCSSE